MGFSTFFKLGLTILLGIVSWACYLIIFRLFFHPCRHIPGPLLARISYVYAFYYDVILGGCMAENLLKVHARYGEFDLVLLARKVPEALNLLATGPIVRIGPDMVHVQDSKFFQQCVSCL